MVNKTMMTHVCIGIVYCHFSYGKLHMTRYYHHKSDTTTTLHKTMKLPNHHDQKLTTESITLHKTMKLNCQIIVIRN